MTDHTVKSFGEQLETLSALVAQMGGLTEAQLASAIEAISRRDSAAAERAVGGDARIDEMQAQIEERALKLLALRQPMAVDLRETLAGAPLEAHAKGEARKTRAVRREERKGRGGALVERLEGCFSNVIGLSLPLLRRWLRDRGTADP
jgi:phosphate uptake regulator